MKYDKKFIKDLTQAVKNKLNSERFAHTQRVVETALEIAERLNLDKNKVQVAALVHDCAKNLDKNTIRELAYKSCWEIDDLEFSIDPVLHAPAGAYIARKEFKIKNYDILEAVRFHSIGSPNLGKLGLVIFTADIIEPGRDFKNIDIIRKKIKEDFKTGVIYLCEESIVYNFEKGEIVHPNTLLLRNFLLEGKSK